MEEQVESIGIYPRLMQRAGNYSNVSFTIELMREVLGDLFYARERERRVTGMMDGEYFTNYIPNNKQDDDQIVF